MTIQALTIVDWLIIGAAILAFATGYRRGFITQLLSVAGLLASLVIAYLFHDDLAPYLAVLLPLDSLAQNTEYEFLFSHFKVDQIIYNVLAFAILFFVIRLALTIVRHFLNFVVKAPGLNALNRWAGVALALLEALLLVTLAIYILMVIPSDSLQRALNESFFVPYLLQWPSLVTEKIPSLPFLREDVVQAGELLL